MSPVYMLKMYTVVLEVRVVHLVGVEQHHHLGAVHRRDGAGAPAMLLVLDLDAAPDDDAERTEDDATPLIAAAHDAEPAPQEPRCTF